MNLQPTVNTTDDGNLPMWRWSAALVVLLLGSVYPDNLMGVEPDGASLLAKSQSIRIELVLGRLTATHLHPAHRLPADSTIERVPGESLSIDITTGIPRVRYERKDSEQSVHLEILNQSEIAVNSLPLRSEHGAVVQFLQLPGKPVELSIGTGTSQKRIQHDSLWHMMIADPEPCRLHLVPLLRLMRTNWDLLKAAEQVEERLLIMTDTSAPLRQPELLKLLQQLDNFSFAHRQAADRELRKCGVGVLPFLQSVDWNRLSAEQQLRIQQIREYLGAGMADNPIRVASWLAYDSSLWLTMLSDERLSRRKVAFGRLQRLCNESIKFDPTGSETVRREQLARLRQQIVSR